MSALACCQQLRIREIGHTAYFIGQINAAVSRSQYFSLIRWSSDFRRTQVIAACSLSHNPGRRLRQTKFDPRRIGELIAVAIFDGGRVRRECSLETLRSIKAHFKMTHPS